MNKEKKFFNLNFKDIHSVVFFILDNNLVFWVLCIIRIEQQMDVPSVKTDMFLAMKGGRSLKKTRVFVRIKMTTLYSNSKS
jgi:hypothetical protein